MRTFVLAARFWPAAVSVPIPFLAQSIKTKELISSSYTGYTAMRRYILLVVIDSNDKGPSGE